MTRPSRNESVHRHGIVLGDDGTPASEGARHAALHLARAWQAPLDVVTVHTPWREADLEAVDAFRARCRRHKVDATRVEVRGDASTHLLQAARTLQAGLIILGSHHRRRILPPVGSVGRTLLASSSIPVLVVRNDAWPPEHLVIGDDGSDEARDAADLAADIGRLFGANAELVGAVPELHAPIPELLETSRMVAHYEGRRVAEDARAVAERLAGPAVAVLSHVKPARALRNSVDAAAHGHVLVAVGSSGRSQLERYLGWSVSSSAVDFEEASVLVVPRGGVRVPLGQARGSAHSSRR